MWIWAFVHLCLVTVTGPAPAVLPLLSKNSGQKLKKEDCEEEYMYQK